MVDDINNMESPPDINYLKNNYQTVGNFDLFFENLSKVKTLYGFAYNTSFINYDLLQNGLNCPAYSYQGSFYSTYASGDIQLEKLFKNISSVSDIQTSFVATTALNISELTQATFKITENMFQDFTKLQYLGYLKSGSFTGGGISTSSFCGSGITRTINSDTFPYNIFSKCSNLQTIEGFFQNITKGESSLSGISLPGSLFENNTKLTSISGLFRYFPFTFKLTSNGFEKCTNLQRVDYLFYNAGNNFTGYIPNKFFYHGGKDINITYTGANLQNKYDPFEEQEDGTIRGIDENDIENIEITYHDPYKTITHMEYCFSGCNINNYQNTNLENKKYESLENNPDYLPFTHIINNDIIRKVTFNNLEKTIIWEYDGVHVPKIDNPELESKIENLDEEHDTRVYPEIKYNDEWSTSSSLNFICSPDLFRYCSNSGSLNINGIFSSCGYNSNADAQWVSPRIENYGLKGRIVPYLFKPISNVTSIEKMFYRCSLLSSYEYNQQAAYVIPKTLFSYATKINNLKYAFYGTTYPQNINLDIFQSLIGPLYIDGIFMYCRFNGTPQNSAKISQVFKNKSIITLIRAFSANDSDTGQSSNNIKRDQYVTFEDNFTKSKIAKDADRFVFDGYSASTVKFVPSLDETESKHNYRTI